MTINYLKPNFKELWSVCKLDQDNYIDRDGRSRSKTLAIKKVCNAILLNKGIYLRIEKATRVPWDLVAAIHFKECSLRLNGMLHNGEPLNIKSRIVPIGVGPFANFEESAIHALKRRGCDKIKTWDEPTCLEFAEGYNGKGYRKKGILSPYVFGFTNLSDEQGGYPKDHVWDSTYPYRRPGVAAILIYMRENKL